MACIDLIVDGADWKRQRICCNISTYNGFYDHISISLKKKMSWKWLQQEIVRSVLFGNWIWGCMIFRQYTHVISICGFDLIYKMYSDHPTSIKDTVICYDNLRMMWLCNLKMSLTW